MLGKFRGFLGYSKEEFKELWGNALFVVDTNVLINFYRYTHKQTTKSLFDILKKLKDSERFWIPHQVALEYFFNHENNMYKQKEGYDTLGNELKKLKNVAKKNIEEIQSKHPYIQTENFLFFIERQEESNKLLQDKLEEEIKKLPDPNTIKKEILELLDGIIGDTFSQTRIDEIEENGKDRYENEVPPGFEDKNDRDKQGFRVYGNVKYQRLFGDLIVWEQMIEKATREKKPIIFITEEKKEDWWEKENGKIKRPQPHLIQEFLEKTKQKFYMYRTDTFVKHAKDLVDAPVTDEQVETVRQEVETLRRVDEKKEERKIIDIDIKKILSYLELTEKRYFKGMIAKCDPDTSLGNIQYNQAINWALNTVLPKLENHFFQLAHLMGGHHSGYAKTAFDAYEKLPNDIENRVGGLLKILDFLDEQIGWYESQGY